MPNASDTVTESSDVQESQVNICIYIYILDQGCHTYIYSWNSLSTDDVLWTETLSLDKNNIG